MDILVERAGGVLTLTFNRPDRKNAITAAMYQTLADALVNAQSDPSVRAILLRGSPGIFSAGNDLEDFLKAPPVGNEAPVFQFLHALSTAEKPLVAAVAGAAVGIGTTMLLHCDLVYAADTAKFSLPFAQLGLCPEAASSLLLPRIAGYQAAAEKLLLGEAFDAQEALRMGFVNQVTGKADWLEKALELASVIARRAPIAVKLAKQAVLAAETGLEGGLDAERRLFELAMATEDRVEGTQAFLEKRKPDFKGR